MTLVSVRKPLKSIKEKHHCEDIVETLLAIYEYTVVSPILRIAYVVNTTSHHI